MKKLTKVIGIVLLVIAMSLTIYIIPKTPWFTEQIDEEFITEFYNESIFIGKYKESILIGKYNTFALDMIIIDDMDRVCVPTSIAIELSEAQYAIFAFNFNGFVSENRGVFHYTSVIDMNIDSEEREVVWSLYNSNNTILPCTITASERGKCEVDDFGKCKQDYIGEVSCVE